MGLVYTGLMVSPPAKKGEAGPKARAPVRVMTKQRMENIAKFHVERFAATASHLKQVLLRRAERARRVHGGEKAEYAAWAEEIVAKMVRTGAVNDARYALGRATSLRRLAKGPGKIRAALRAKGVAQDLIDKALLATAVTDSDGDATWEAALAYARRRRLGPFGKQEGDADARRKQATKDLAAICRAGFPYDVAKRVMKGDVDES